MYPDACGRLELFIAMEPAWIIGGEHVRFDPLRELRRDLQRSLHADTAGRREVETHDQNLHRPRMIGTPALPKVNVSLSCR